MGSLLCFENWYNEKPAYNGRFCEMAAVTPQTILCKFARLSPAGSVVEAPPAPSRRNVVGKPRERGGKRRRTIEINTIKIK